jgi:hypothetical protein
MCTARVVKLVVDHSRTVPRGDPTRLRHREISAVQGDKARHGQPASPLTAIASGIYGRPAPRQIAERDVARC